MHHITQSIKKLFGFVSEQVTAHIETGYNFVFLGKTEEKHPVPVINIPSYEAHQRVLKNSFNKHLYPWEIDRIINGYRRPNITFETLEADFFNGDIPEHHVPKDEYYYKALSYTMEMFKPPRPCRPVHILDIKHHYPFKNHPSAEAPFSTKDIFWRQLPSGARRSVGNMKDIIFENTRRWLHEIKYGIEPPHRHFYYMIIHLKSALVKRDDPDKARTIFGVPKPWILAQIMFFWSYFNWAKRTKSTPLLWGYETFNGGWLHLNNELYTGYLRVSFLMIDWKRFDKYAHFTVIRDLFRIMRTFVTFGEGYVPTVNYPNTQQTWHTHQEDALQRLWDWTLEAFENTPILMPDGRVYKRKHAGIPSGLYITQFLDSMYNMTMICTILSSLGFHLNRKLIMKLMGDDSLVRLNVLIPPNQHASFLAVMQTKASYYFGSIIAVEKSKMSNTLNGCEVLSYYNHNGLPHRDPDALLAQFYHTKARSPTPERTMASAVGFAYASCGFEPRVYNVCKDIYEFYRKQGIVPDPAGLRLALGDDPMSLTIRDIDLSRFPSKLDIQGRLFSLDYQNESNLNTFWNQNYFLADF